MGDYKVGNKVVFTAFNKHIDDPQFYPPVGTVGVIGRIDFQDDLWVRWEAGSTSDIDYWCADKEWVKPYDQGTDSCTNQA